MNVKLLQYHYIFPFFISELCNNICWTFDYSKLQFLTLIESIHTPIRIELENAKYYSELLPTNYIASLINRFL